MKLLTLVVVSLLLSGCSFRSQLFIQNRNQTTDVLITIVYKVSKVELSRQEANMEYVPQLLTPKQYQSNQTKKKLTITDRSDSTLTVLIPPLSTARIVSDSNMKYMDQILEISLHGKHIPMKELIATSKKYRWDYVYLTK